MMLDLHTLQLIWWVLLGVLMIGFAILDGFDMGIAILLPFLGKTSKERQIMINSIGPVWESNQVWLIVGAGAIFAAWPLLYAVTFSSLYLPMFVILSSLILRPVSFKFRTKIFPKFWDVCLFISGFFPAFLFGITIGNVFKGLPFRFNEEMRVSYEGNFWDLFSLYTILWGILSLSLMITQGLAYLSVKTESFQTRIFKVKNIFLGCSLTCFAYILFHHLTMKGYTLSNNIVSVQKGAWTLSSSFIPLLYSLGCLFMLSFFIKKPLFFFVFSSLIAAHIIAITGISLYPFLLPSSLHTRSSLTLWNASSSSYTLWIMLLSALILLPIVLTYVTWMYRVFRHKSDHDKDYENH